MGRSLQTGDSPAQGIRRRAPGDTIPAVKRVLLIIAVAAFAAAAPSTASAASNPGFEQGLTGWHATNGQMKLAAPHSGKYSLQLYGASTEQKMTVQPDVAPVT